MAKLFGTDGVRGVANSDLSAEVALSLGRAAARALGGAASSNFVIARDTRRSGDLLQSALSAGLMSMGATVMDCGILPTPAVAFLVPDLKANAGVVISASHNPARDNGIKFFGSDGFKLSDEVEDEIEALMTVEAIYPTGDLIGHLVEVDFAEDKYIEHALKSLEGLKLDGLKVVVDCASGAAYRTTPEALRRAGAEVVSVNVQPTGMNINDGSGSNHPEVIAKAVLDTGAHVGLAHDGDADRVIAVDETGSVVDGDTMIAILGKQLMSADKLPGDSVVITVMSNLGLRRTLVNAGINVIETAVGDRYVIEAMRAKGASLGGEQSGHVIFLDYATTGDGLVTGLRLLAEMKRSGKRLSELASQMERFPQVLLNVPVVQKDRLKETSAIWKAVADAEEKLGDDGRVLVRPSGTEPVVRVMVEANHAETAQKIAEEIAEVVKTSLGST